MERIHVLDFSVQRPRRPSLNFIRLLRVVITPSGENDSKQWDEFQATRRPWFAQKFSTRRHFERMMSFVCSHVNSR